MHSTPAMTADAAAEHRFTYATLAALGAGALLSVLAVSSYRSFDLDRFFVPKELSFHTTATIAGLAALAASPRLRVSRVDVAMVVWLMLSVVSALFAANGWLAGRAVSISLSSAVVFWSARRIATAGLSAALASLLAVAVVAGAATALAQAYGVRMEFATLSRAPGGTLGNRNFMAHLAAVGVPLLLWQSVAARSRIASALFSVGLLVCTAAIVLSRTRAAWLALMVWAGVAVITLLRCPPLLDTRAARLRAWRTGGVIAAGIALALVLPNRLDWRSDSPYLESVRGVVNYREGSGRGRLRQYANSAKMAVAHPLLGVGPGNWPVQYPRYAPAADPSLVEDTGMTANPWPSSDWIAALSERGVAATVALTAIVTLLIGTAGRALFDPKRSADERFAIAVGASVVAIAVLEGAFDAVLLLPAPALVVWGATGALLPAGREWRTVTPTPWVRRALALSLLAFGCAAGAMSAARITSMSLYSVGTLASLERASRFDPGSYRIRMKAAEANVQQSRCKDAVRQATAARSLFPRAPAPRRILAQCGAR